MKKNNFFGFFAACFIFGFVACNDNNTSNDSTIKDSVTGGTATSVGQYAARADSVQVNVSASNYLNPRTGQVYTVINVDPNTGALTDENGEPIVRYIDKRTWWVYDVDSWDTVSHAKIENDIVLFEDNNNWVKYDVKWKDDKMKSGDTKIKDDKMKSGDTKIKDDKTKKD